MAEPLASLQRASERGLARRARQRDPGTGEFLAFVMGDDVYAVDLRRIKEIVSPPPITEVPRAPADVVGVCSVRGLLVTVVDLRRRLHLFEKPLTRLARILLVATRGGEVLGLLVDQVRQVIRIKPQDIETSGAIFGGDLPQHVLGIGRPGGELVIFLELSLIVADGGATP